MGCDPLVGDLLVILFLVACTIDPVALSISIYMEAVEEAYEIGGALYSNVLRCRAASVPAWCDHTETGRRSSPLNSTKACIRSHSRSP